MAATGYGRSGRILIVDRDPATCEMLSGVLRMAGLETACAWDDSAAYTLIPTVPTFRALVVEADLGTGTTGFDVARFARRVIPDLLVIYLSGDASSTSVETFGVPGGEFIRKPFSPDDLVRRLGERT